jgi:sugar O-acyltransferase (sialic acid O-acetyltransferase NeuD family)
MKPVATAVVWGGTGQAKVVGAILAGMGIRPGVVYDCSGEVASPFKGVPIIHDEDELFRWVDGRRRDAIGFVVAIGGDRGRDRLDIADRLAALGLVPLTLVHDSAFVARSATLGEGCQVLAMAAISEDAQLGRQVIVNTNATIDHECRIYDGVHVMPGAVLAGCVEVGARAMIGSNATILPRVRIGAGARVGAGAVVTRDVPSNTTVVGSPAHPEG